MTAGAPVRLRPLRWWDIDGLVPLERELFGGTAWSAETFWSELAQPSRWYLLAVAGAEEVVGYAGVSTVGTEADVQTIAVAPDARGRGVGAALLGALIERAGAGGARSLMLEVRGDNPTAIGLYERFGFTRIAVRPRYYQPEDVDAWIMRLRPLPVTGGAE